MTDDTPDIDLTPDEWRANYDSPAWVRRQRDALTALGADPPRSLARLSPWLDRHKGVVTRKLKALEADSSDEPDTDDAEGDVSDPDA